MAKKSSSTLAEGTRIRARIGTTAPESPETSMAGWSGTVIEVSGKKTPAQYVVEWDDATVQNMPAAYVTQCEAAGLYYRMACLSEQDIEKLA